MNALFLPRVNRHEQYAVHAGIPDLLQFVVSGSDVTFSRMCKSVRGFTNPSIKRYIDLLLVHGGDALHDITFLHPGRHHAVERSKRRHIHAEERQYVFMLQMLPYKRFGAESLSTDVKTRTIYGHVM